MTSQSRALVLLLAMFWQALAWLTPVQLDQQVDAIAHMAVHAQDVDHHHHTEQTLHIEEGGNQPPHQHAHQAVQVPGLPPPTALASAEPIPPVLVPSVTAGHAPVFLEGPLRPPQPVAQRA